MLTKFSKYVIDDRCIFKHAKGTAAAPDREFHDYHEILLFAGGKTTFLSEEKRIPLTPPGIVIIPKETYHQFINEVDEEYHRSVFSFYDIPEFEELIKKCMHSTRIIEARDDQKALFNRMNETTDADCSDKEKQVLMYSVLALLLYDLSRESASVKEGGSLCDITYSSIEYINSNLCSRISVSELSKRLNVSVSTLTQTFKKDMNISIYRFILRKRLILAKQKINDGEAATAVALQCGFHDYSGFYRQYKKMFGAAPSEKSEGFDAPR